MSPCSNQIFVRDVTTQGGRGYSRVSAMVDGSEVWFESPDADLTPTGEAFGTAFLIPALHNGATLTFEHPTDAKWFEGARALIDVVADWWDLPTCQPKGPTAAARPTAAGTGLCFTAGVDSFFSLLRSGQNIDTLVHIQGFDIPLRDTDRLRSAEHDARAVADALNLRCVVVRSNLREHPMYLPIPWDKTHGGAIIGVGHLLTNILGRLVISSSVHWSAARQHLGSNDDIDRKWASTALEVIHAGHEWWRFQKVQQIAHEPLVQKYLRVCWEHRSPEPNCSRCEKCLRTMITLHEAGVLADVSRFDNGPIAERLDRIDQIAIPTNHLELLFMLEEVTDPGIAAALKRLSARSGPPASVDSSLDPS